MFQNIFTLLKFPEKVIYNFFILKSRYGRAHTLALKFLVIVKVKVKFVPVLN